MRRRRRFKLVVFDWDGTLMDSQRHIVRCMRRAIADRGLPPPREEAVAEIIGLGLPEAVARLLPEAPASERKAVADTYRDHFLSQRHGASELFPAAREVLHSLVEDGYRLAVATGKGRSGLDQALEKTGLAPLFAATRCADETRSKPHPQMLRELMAETGVVPEATLMIGDTEYDLQMASRAGVPALAVSYGAHPRERLLRCGPLGCIDDLREIPEWLRERAEEPSLQRAGRRR